MRAGWRLVGAMVILASWSCSDDDSGLDGGRDSSADAASDAPGDAAQDALQDVNNDTEADLGQPDAFSIPAFVSIAAGTFTMGSPVGEPCRFHSNEDQHQVTLTHGFAISDHEVTQGEFQALRGYNPAYFASCGPSCPVEQVSWHEAVDYCNALSAQLGLAACYTCSGSGASVTCAEAAAYSGQNIYGCPGFRLPTDAEWEYAYRAGTTTAFYNGPNDSTKCFTCTDANAAAIAWHHCNSGGTTHAVKLKLANAWGLYDMAGNVMEWCHDSYESSLGSSAITDPVGVKYSSRVVRGGYWGDHAAYVRAAGRNNSSPAFYVPTRREYTLGFRCIRSI